MWFKLNIVSIQNSTIIMTMSDKETIYILFFIIFVQSFHLFTRISNKKPFEFSYE